MNFVQTALISATITGLSIIQIYGQSTNDTLKISLTDVWRKSDAFSKLVKIKETSVKISNEEIKDAKMERFPELGLVGMAEKVSNIPIYDNGLFNHPSLLANGMFHSRTLKASQKLLVNTVNGQSQIRFAMDYYELMAWILFGVIILVALFPYIKRTVIYLKSRKLSPA